MEYFKLTFISRYVFSLNSFYFALSIVNVKEITVLRVHVCFKYYHQLQAIEILWQQYIILLVETFVNEHTYTLRVTSDQLKSRMVLKMIMVNS